jgi:hypothetical protein
MWPDWLSGSKAMGLTTIPAAYLLGRYAAAPIARKFMPGMDDEEYSDFSKRIGNLGAAGTGLGWLGFAAAPEWNYLNQNSQSFSESLGNYLNKSWYTKQGSLFGEYTVFPKNIQDPTNVFEINPEITAQQHYLRTYASNQIPVQSSINLLNQDPVLNQQQKIILINTVAQANQDKPTGLISIQDVVRTALDTGLGAFTGLALGKVLALPQRSQSILSRVGAIGNFLISTGIVN